MPLELWLPPEARPKTMRCAGCGAKFPYDSLAEKRKVQNHVARCGEEQIQEEYEDRLSNGFLVPQDPERHDYLRRKQARKEKINWYREGLVH